ncbi:MAG: DinB family protein [Ignavibacteriales bacterium]|nr:DinB family protein [Ignavibacteriales bacterium]
MEIELLIEFCRAVRESTIKRLAIVPEGYENWKVSPGALSFSEIAKHIIDLDNWLIEKIKNPGIKSIETETAITKDCDSNGYKELINNLKEVLETKIEFIKTFDEDSLNKKIFDDRFNSEVSIAWIILRGNIDHEIHHRGQIAVYLRVLKDKNIIII